MAVREQYKKISYFICIGCSFLLTGAIAPVYAKNSAVNDELDIPSLYTFHEQDLQFLQTFHLTNLPRVPDDISLILPNDAATLGHQLFFDVALSDQQKFSCASCHQPEHYFTDAKPVADAFSVLTRNTPTVVAAAYSPWQYWDGRKDSLWSQALEPLEAEAEMRSDRLTIVKYVLNSYQRRYEKIFDLQVDLKTLNALSGPASPEGGELAVANWQQLSENQQSMINRHFTNIGKLLMAYEQKLLPSESRFDRFVQALQEKASVNELQKIYEHDEVAGLRLFMGKANCAGCHNGPLFTNYEFHNIGVPEFDQNNVDLGRLVGAKQLINEEFSCLSEYGDGNEESCLEFTYVKTEGRELIGAFKTPSLRNIELTAPYMQSGQFADLKTVVKHYNKPTPPFFNPKQHPQRPHFDVFPLGLTEVQEEQLVKFLQTLTDVEKNSSPWFMEPK